MIYYQNNVSDMIYGDQRIITVTFIISPYAHYTKTFIRSTKSSKGVQSRQTTTRLDAHIGILTAATLLRPAPSWSILSCFVL